MAGSTLDTILLTDTFHTWFIRTNQAIEELNTVIDSGISAAGLSGDHLWLYLHGGITFDVGHVVGETGPGISFGGLSGADLVFTKTDGSLLTIANVKGEQGLQGVQGQQGPQGPTGNIGPAGQGVPTGGTQGYVLTKGTSGDYDTQWTDVTAIVKKKPGFVGGRQYESDAGVRPNSYIYLPDVHAGASITQDVMRGFTCGFQPNEKASAGSDILNWQFNDELSSTGGWYGGNFAHVNQEDAGDDNIGAQFFVGPTLKLIPMYIPTYTVFRRYVMWIDDIGTTVVAGHTFDHFSADGAVGNPHSKNTANFYTRESEDGRQYRFYSQLGHGQPNVHGRDHYFTNQGNTAGHAGHQGGGSAGLAEHAQGMYLRMALLNTKNGEPNKLVAGSTSEWYLKGATGWTAPGNRKAKYQGHGNHTPYHVGSSGPHGFTCGAGATGAFLEPGWYWMYFECIPAAWIAHHPEGYSDLNGDSDDSHRVRPGDRNRYTTIIIPHTDYDKGRGTDLIGLDSWDLAPTERQNAFRSHIADFQSYGDGTTSEMGWSAAAYPDGGTGYTKLSSVGSTGAQAAYWSPTHYMASNGIHVQTKPEFSGSWCIVLGHFTGLPMQRPTWAPNFGVTGTQDMSHATGGVATGGVGLVDDRTYQPEPIHGIAGQNTSGGKGIFRPQNIYQARCPRVGIEIFKTFESSEDAGGGGYGGNVGGLG